MTFLQKTTTVLFYILILGVFNTTQAQLVYKAKDVYDSTYGIIRYEKLNAKLRGDSIRNCKGYACNGWVRDYYESGAVLHKGYYFEGQLKIYYNYYESGQLEREYKWLDDVRSIMKTYYPNSVLRSEIEYKNNAPIKWHDYYASGKPEYTEENSKNGDYYELKESYYENGNMEEQFVLLDKKKKKYTHKFFHENGQLKEEGYTFYNPDTFDYQREGEWNIYNEKGKKVAEQTYIGGKVNEERKIN